MTPKKPLHAQRGATLVMGMILLAVLMVTVTASFVMSNNNFKAVGNMQSKAEAAAAAEAAIERIISSTAIFLSPAAVTLPANEYGTVVNIAAPVCVRSMVLENNNSGDQGNNIYQEGYTNPAPAAYVETNWDIQATASTGATGARVVVHQGVKIILPADPNPCP